MTVMVLDGFCSIVEVKITMGSYFGSISVVFLPPYDRTHDCGTNF